MLHLANSRGSRGLSSIESPFENPSDRFKKFTDQFYPLNDQTSSIGTPYTIMSLP
jgi:hypothetical protein